MKDFRRKRIALAVGTGLGLLLAWMVSPFDVVWSNRLRTMNLPGDFDKVIMLSEFLAQGLTTLLMLGTLIYLDASRRKALGWVLLLTLVTGVVANVSKGLFPRVRPYALEEFPGLVSQAGWGVTLPEEGWKARLRSFPSGHSATVAALALGMSAVYPKGGLLFALWAALACLQRVVAGAHYPSDVLGGVAIALAIATLWPWKTMQAASQRTMASDPTA
ncbi:MAG: phosphatase PAP2 family protein [Pirellulaceae bacterium]